MCRDICTGQWPVTNPWTWRHGHWSGFSGTQYKKNPQCKQEFYLCFMIDHASITLIMCNSEGEEEVAPGPCLCQPGAWVPGWQQFLAAPDTSWSHFSEKFQKTFTKSSCKQNVNLSVLYLYSFKEDTYKVKHQFQLTLHDREVQWQPGGCPVTVRREGGGSGDNEREFHKLPRLVIFTMLCYTFFSSLALVKH